MKQVSCKKDKDKAFYLSFQQLVPTVSLSRFGLPSMYGQALMAGTQMIVERPQADKIINAATFVKIITDMEFVQNFTPPDFQVENFTPSISPNFNSFSKKKHKKLVKIEKFTPLAKILHCRRQ